jgi:hypothetical protein
MVMLFIACPKSRDADIKIQLNVFGVIRSDFNHQQVVIDRTYAMDDTTWWDLENSFVTMTGDTFCDTLHTLGYEKEFTGFYHPVETGQTYKIMVAAEGLDTLWGETTVPGAYTVIFPQPGDTIDNSDTILIRKSPGGKIYEFGLYQNDTMLCSYMSFPDFLTDSLFRFPVSELYLGDGDWRLEIAAYDSNFFNYQYSSNEYPQCGVRGGLGAFCSAYVNSIEFYFQYQP